MMWKITGRLGNDGHNTSFLAEAENREEAEELGCHVLSGICTAGEYYEIVDVTEESASQFTINTEQTYWDDKWRGQIHAPTTRQFPSGASRDTDDGKLDYVGFLSPLVLKRFAEYMHAHRKMSDGSLRASDNWKKGIPKEQYVKSLLRHTIDVWTAHEQGNALPEEELCGVLFNSMGLLYESLVGD